MRTQPCEECGNEVDRKENRFCGYVCASRNRNRVFFAKHGHGIGQNYTIEQIHQAVASLRLGQSWAAAGAVIGMSEDAFRKRVRREDLVEPWMSLHPLLPQSIFISPPSPAVAAYLAGLIDGEGTIVQYFDGKRRDDCVHLSIANTDRSNMLQWLLDNVGGALYERNADSNHLGNLQGYTWQVHPTLDKLAVLLAIEPYMTTKRIKAQQAIGSLWRQAKDRAPALHIPEIATASYLDEDAA